MWICSMNSWFRRSTLMLATTRLSDGFPVLFELFEAWSFLRIGFERGGEIAAQAELGGR